MRIAKILQVGASLSVAFLLTACPFPQARGELLVVPSVYPDPLWFYSTAGTSDVVTTKADWSGATSINLAYTQDTSYSPCMELVGSGSWATSVAFEDFDSRLLSAFTSLEFKIKTVDNSDIKVKVPELEKSYALTSGMALGDGWTLMSIPLADFASVIEDANTEGATALGIFGAASTTIRLTDIGLLGLKTQPLTVTVKQGYGALASALGNAAVTVGNTTRRTGTDGSLVFQVADGPVSVTVAKSGYTTQSTSALVSGGAKSLAVTLAMERAPSVSTDTWTPGASWALAWNDEFSSPSLDSAKWVFQEEDAGRFNNELQSYTASSDNCFVTSRTQADGAMVIQALNTGTGIGMGDFTSARMITHPAGTFLYGKIAARIQVPYGKGLWPAFWMLGSNISENPGGTVGWPQCGEIDILEKRGGTDAKEREVIGSYHFANASNNWEYHSGSRSLPGWLSNDFHVYEVEWNVSAIVWKIDGIEYFSVDTTSAMFDEFRKPFYILLNVAVGGIFDGNPDSTTSFPQNMFIDWVRVYR